MVALPMPSPSSELAAMLRLLRRLEIPDCERDHPGECDHKPMKCSCKERREKGVCHCPPVLPPPCDYILGRDHDVEPERWATLLAKYQPTYWEGHDGIDVMHDGEGGALPALRPTAARPGSDAKILLMRERLARGEHIHSEFDAQTADFLGLGETLGFSQNGMHPRLGIARLSPGVGVRIKPEKKAG